MPDWIAATLLTFGVILSAVLFSLAITATMAAYGVPVAIGVLVLVVLIGVPTLFYFTLGR